MSGKVIHLEEARLRAGQRENIREAWDAWLERIETERPALIPRLLSNIVETLGVRHHRERPLGDDPAAGVDRRLAG